MAKNSITDYSKTAASNTDIQSVDIDEGCAPSGINNAIRELMVDLAEMNDGTVTLTSPAVGSIGVTGNITVGGTVDGRDVATDGTKLDGIEAGATADQTKADIDALGIDAATLDGIDSSSFLRSDQSDTFTGTLTLNFGSNQIYLGSDGAIELTRAAGGAYIDFKDSTSEDYDARIQVSGTDLNLNGSKIWTAGNDGSGSGLDADTLDGVHASGFISSTADDTASGDITFAGLTTFNGGATGGYPQVRIGSGSSSSTSYLYMGNSSDYDHGGFTYANTTGRMTFKSNAADRMSIESNGRIVNRTHMNAATAPAFAMKNASNDVAYDTGMYSPDVNLANAIGFSVDGDLAFLIHDGYGNHISGGSDNKYNLGTSAKRWKDVWAVDTSINSSDENLKQQISPLTDDEITAAKAISKLFKTYKWNDSVEEKGDDARTHTGHVAQEVKQAMEDAGLDATKYAFWCSDTWWEEDVEYPAVEAIPAQEAVYDDDGNLLAEAVEGIAGSEAYTESKVYLLESEAPEGAVKKTLLSLRYAELLAFIGAATEQRLTDIETRLAALEN